jgi:hypothetical protein
MCTYDDGRGEHRYEYIGQGQGEQAEDLLGGKPPRRKRIRRRKRRRRRDMDGTGRIGHATLVRNGRHDGLQLAESRESRETNQLRPVECSRAQW